MSIVDDARGLFLLIVVYEPLMGAVFLILRGPLETSLNVIYAGNGGFVWLILWLLFGGVPPAVAALEEIVSRH